MLNAFRSIQKIYEMLWGVNISTCFEIGVHNCFKYANLQHTYIYLIAGYESVTVYDDVRARKRKQ